MTPGRIVFINPNSTVAMTDAMVAAASDAAPSVGFDGWTSHQGPPAIQGEEDGRLAVPPLLELVQRASDDGAAAIVIGCFDDTGLAEARALARCPVIGLGQAACALALLAAERFSVVTTLSVSIPVIEGNIRAAGLGGRLGRVRASGIPVLQLEERPEVSAQRLHEEVEAAGRDDGVGAVLLGCAGMSAFAADLRRESPLAIVDPVEAAARLAAAAAALRCAARVGPAPN